MKDTRREGQDPAGPLPRTQSSPGRRLRHARLVKGYTLRRLAEIAECSESMLSKLENSRLSPSLAMLDRLATALDTTVADLLVQPPGETPEERVKVFPASRFLKTFAARGAEDVGPLFDRVLPFERSGLLQVSMLHLPPESEQKRVYNHEGEEFVFVLQGTLDIIVEDRAHRVSVGDGIFFASVLGHRYANTGTEPVRALWVNTPPTM